MKKKKNHLQDVKILSGRSDILPEVSLPSKKANRKKPVRTSAKNDMREKRLEKKIILTLQLKGYYVAKSGESSVYNGRHILSGMSDLIVFLPEKGVVFMEVKDTKGKMRDTQLRFEKLCFVCCVKYVVVRSVKEAIESIRNI